MLYYLLNLSAFLDDILDDMFSGLFNFLFRLVFQLVFECIRAIYEFLLDILTDLVFDILVKIFYYLFEGIKLVIKPLRYLFLKIINFIKSFWEPVLDGIVTIYRQWLYPQSTINLEKTESND